MSDHFNKSLFISIAIHALIFIQIPLISMVKTDNSQLSDLTEKDIDFLLSHLLPYSPPTETSQNDQVGSGRHLTKQEKITRYGYDVLRPRIYNNLKTRLNEVKGSDDVLITIVINKDGSLDKMAFVKNSEDENKDEIFLDAIRKSAPFPSLEEIIDMESVVFTCRFKLSEVGQ
ncbi:MAG: TonB C-terminal domain-containing protein [Planctomycetes bacterium]|nr:TonB C-terminal domain-containing protein [Planctomycetota bacterium]